MKTTSGFWVTALAAAMLAAAPVATSFADVPPIPPPNGMHLRPGMMVCNVCGGKGTHGHTWYGFRKTCKRCDGKGMIPRPVPPPPPPKPPKPVKPVVKPVPHGAPHPVAHPTAAHPGKGPGAAGPASPSAPIHGKPVNNGKGPPHK